MDIVNAVRKHALANYLNDGWDVVFEAWDDADILAAAGNAATAEQAIENVALVSCQQHDFAESIRAEFPAGEFPTHLTF